MNCSDDVLEYWMGRVADAVDMDGCKVSAPLSLCEMLHCFLFCQAMQAQSLDGIDTRLVKIDLLLHEIRNLIRELNHE